MIFVSMFCAVFSTIAAVYFKQQGASNFVVQVNFAAAGFNAVIVLFNLAGWTS